MKKTQLSLELQCKKCNRTATTQVCYDDIKERDFLSMKELTLGCIVCKNMRSILIPLAYTKNGFAKWDSCNDLIVIMTVII